MTKTHDLQKQVSEVAPAALAVAKYCDPQLSETKNAMAALERTIQHHTVHLNRLERQTTATYGIATLQESRIETLEADAAFTKGVIAALADRVAEVDAKLDGRKTHETEEAERT